MIHFMNTLKTEIEIAEDGSVKLLSPLPAWLKPGRAHAQLTLVSVNGEKSKRPKLTATPEMIAQRMVALEDVRKLAPYRDITDPVAWQKEIRADVVLPRGQ